MLFRSYRFHRSFLVRLLAVLLIADGKVGYATVQDILLDGAGKGQVLDGIGALSAGASSRLLIDYPEPQRSEILDFLFKPGFGASLQRLKVEIGGEINSTDGTEPTHMRSAADLNYHRGYEWWLMKEAVKRNPGIILGCLPWGAPAWIGNGHFFSQDMADYVVNFIEGAKQEHGLTFHYTGIWNERAWHGPWIKTLRETLDRRGFEAVKIVAADEMADWKILQTLAADPELMAIVDVVGSHYPFFQSPQAAKDLGKPIWASEDGTWAIPWKNDWESAAFLGKIINRNYVGGRISATDIWSLVTSYYDALTFPNSGHLRANTPWSGHYEVLPGIWSFAHTTQFTRPGWKYIDSASIYLQRVGASVATLRATNNSDYTIIIETVDATMPQEISFRLTNGLPSGSLNIWRTTESNYFSRTGRITPAHAKFSFTAEPGSLYTITTLQTGGRGSSAPPPRQPFPLPYRDDFDIYTNGVQPRYLSDQAGSFETVQQRGQAGRVLQQVVDKQGIQWVPEFTPYSLLGEETWSNYNISTEAFLEGDGFISILGRVESAVDIVPSGYYARIYSNPGRCELWKKNSLLTSNSVTFPTGTWHKVRLEFNASTISLHVNGTMVATVKDSTYPAGLAGIGCGFHSAFFDNLALSALHPAGIFGQIAALREGPGVALTFYGSPSANYQLRSKRQLSDAWSAGPTGQADDMGIVRFSDLMNSESAFYQLLVRE